MVLNLRKITPAISLGLLDLAAFSKAEGLAAGRESERAGARYVLGKLLNDEPFELAYSPTNKPYLKDRPEHISISHSHDKLAVICNSAENTGIDIELVRDKVKNIRHKFLNDSESDLAGQDTGKLIMLWAAKETLYKVYGLKEVDFKKHLFVDAVDDDTLTGRICMAQVNKRYSLACESIDNYKLVYVLHEI